MIRAFIIAFLFSVPVFAQTWNQAESLTNLLTRTPVVGGWYSVKGYRVAGDWGDERTAQYVRGDATATNMGNVFNWSGGRLKFFDSTNTIQRISWWGGGPLASDNTKSLTNAANYVSAMGGGYVKADGGTHTFLYGGINLPSGVRLIGDGPNATTFDFTSATPSYAYEPVISWVGTVDSIVTLHSVPTAGDRSIVLSSTVAWANGDWIQLSDTNVFSGGLRDYYNQGEFNFVYSNTGGTNIALLEPLEAAYPTATTTINKITPTVGSAEGIHFALHTDSGPVRLLYADSRSYLKNCSAAGSSYAHFDVRSSYGVTVSDCSVDWDSEPIGYNYGLSFGSSEYLMLGPGNFFRTSRHGITGGGTGIPTRYCRIFASTLGSTRQTVHGADTHGDVFETTFDGCEILSGISLGGGRNRLLNSTVLNGRGAAAVSAAELRYYDLEIRGNRIIASTFDDEPESVWAIRTTFRAGSQSGQPNATNIWAGTFGATSDQTIKILDNEIVPTGVRTNGNYLVFIDEDTTLGANTNITAATFGGIIMRGNRIMNHPEQPFAQLTSPGVVIQLRDKVRFPVIDFSENPLVQGAGITIHPNSSHVTVRGNTFADTSTREGVYVIPQDVSTALPSTFAGSDNTFLRPIGSALTVLDIGGRVDLRQNRIYNHGSINSGNSRYALVADDFASSVGDADLTDNWIIGTNSPSYDVHVATSNALREIGTRTGGAVTAGTRTAGGGMLQVPYSLTAYGSTNAVAALGQFSAHPTNSVPGLYHMADDLWYWNGSSATNFMRSGQTNFASINALNANITNSLAASNLLGNSLSISYGWPVGKWATPSVYPIWVTVNSNTFARAQLYQLSTNSGAGVGYALNVEGQVAGYLGAWGTNVPNSSINARLVTKVDSGKGLGFDLQYPSSMNILFTHGSGSVFATLDTNTFSLPGITTLAPTNTPTHVAIFDADPSSTRRPLKSVTLANLKNSLAITAADITDSTSAGRALLTAANASAQRSSLGLGTIATIDDAPSDGNQYVRSNATWAIASGGGGGISGIRVTDGTTDADGITNILFNPAGGSGFAITVTDMGTRADVDFEWLSPGFGINGTFPTYGTDRWNINDSTPAAPVGGVNVKWQSSGTNASAYVQMTNLLTTFSAGWTNYGTTTNWASVFIPANTLTTDGGAIIVETTGLFVNQSAGNTTPVYGYSTNGTGGLTGSGTALSATAGSPDARAIMMRWRLTRQSSTKASVEYHCHVSAAAGFGNNANASGYIEDNLNWNWAATNSFQAKLGLGTSSTNIWIRFPSIRAWVSQ